MRLILKFKNQFSKLSLMTNKKRLSTIAIITSVMAFAIALPINDIYAGDGDNRVRFELTDEPGPWFKNENPIPGTTESLAIAQPGARVEFKIGGDTETIHTITSLLYPVDETGAIAQNMPFDQAEGHRSGGFDVELEDPGLYVFTCKIHPYMFGAVIIDDPDTEGLDLGENIQIVNGITTPTASPLAVSLLKSFFIVTDPDNWQDYTTGKWNVTFPPVDVRATGGAVVNLSALNIVDADLTTSTPQHDGIGEVWINTQFENTAEKDNVGSSTAVDTSTWTVTKKIALPEIDMNHPHNMWTDLNQDVIYQTMWFDTRLAMFDRETGELIDEITLGHSPSHVMTRPDGNQNIYVAMNGEESNDSVIELEGSATDLDIIGKINIGQPNPHGHWMNADVMVTPNAFTGTSTIHEFDSDDNTIISNSDLLEVSSNAFGVPIATGMHPSGEKYYVANLLDQTITCVSIDTPACVTDSGLVAIKPIVIVANISNLFTLGDLAPIQTGAAGLLPIQTPVSPDGKYVVTATLLPSVTIIDTTTDELVLSLGCDAGCHGVNFGANVNGGYNAYVSSKFSNALIVFDPEEAIAADTDANGILDSSEASGVVGRVLLATANAESGAIIDDTVTALDGMGGQGVLAIPNPYDGWIELTADSDELSSEVQDWIDEMKSNGQDDPFQP